MAATGPLSVDIAATIGRKATRTHTRRCAGLMGSLAEPPGVTRSECNSRGSRGRVGQSEGVLETPSST